MNKRARKQTKGAWGNGVLTLWRERQVRTRIQTEKARATHSLESTKEGTSRDTETNRSSEGHSLSGGCIRQNMSGPREHTKRARGTHKLQSVERGASQDTDINQASEVLTDLKAQRGGGQVRTRKQTE